mmetsp:Transcript_7063/g.13019  ORF Transcript_7063/g.13019 Transcript_7063/m.13019 type:complete len:229 (+) Transcript_7063:207-893(+)
MPGALRITRIMDHSFRLQNLGGNDLDRSQRLVLPGANRFDLLNDIHACTDLAENGMLGRSGGVEPVEIVVVHCVDEKLGPARVRLSGVGHGKSSRFVADLCGKLVLDATIVQSTVRLSVCNACERTSCLRSSGPGATGSRVRRVRTTELKHEVWNHTVESESVVKPVLDEPDEVGAGVRHFLVVRLHGEIAHSGFELNFNHDDGILLLFVSRCGREGFLNVLVANVGP